MIIFLTKTGLTRVHACGFGQKLSISDLDF